MRGNSAIISYCSNVFIYMLLELEGQTGEA